MNVNEPHNYTTVSVGIMIADLLVKHGVRKVFVSPGSRNAHFIGALINNDGLKVEFVVDERSASFAALGYALVAQQPVAVLCTSGSAPLNYSPALSEAFYRHVPLIAITTDRPFEWIGQDDSQTIEQQGIYRNFVKGSFNVPVLKSFDDVWYSNRIVNEALNLARDTDYGPVHINVQIGEGNGWLSCDTDFDYGRFVGSESNRRGLSVADSRLLGAELKSPKKVMIIAGFMPPDSKLNRALNRLAELDNFVVLTETVSNLHGKNFINNIDATLVALRQKDIDCFKPDIVLSLGGSLISRRLKEFLRVTNYTEHWHVGLNSNVVDCFRHLTRRIKIEPNVFFEQLASAMQPHRAPSSYSSCWIAASAAGRSIVQSYAAKARWCDLKAFSRLIPMIPGNWNVQFSNGTPIRYAQLFGEKSYHRCDCNRGVSGIDGCTSTAIGASMAYSKPTLLVSGDTSAFYDMSALGMGIVSHLFKMIVINNGGGGIFRFIKNTRELDFREEFLCGKFKFPLKEISEAFGFKYICADSEDALVDGFKQMADTVNMPVVMEIITPGLYSAEVLSSLLD